MLGFPCNQFGGQEPCSDAEIKKFCEINYKVTFPLFSKIEVNGAHTHALYRLLKLRCPGVMGSEAIKWNFTKFLVDKLGNPLSRFAPTTAPSALIDDIEKVLEA